jgi:hypothetical protein
VADKLHNVRSILADYRLIGDAVWERFAGRREGTLWYYRALLDLFLQGPTNPLIEEFQRNLLTLEQLVRQP